ncbi:MAG: undecaprenyl-diphosphate phosphatase [Pirellulales bacterium]
MLARIARLPYLTILLRGAFALVVAGSLVGTTSVWAESPVATKTEWTATANHATDFAVGLPDSNHASAPAETMTIPQAAVLGVVEGLTEYLPVSSTGHLLLTQRAMGLGDDGGESKEAADAFAVCIQAGAILAVLGLYWKHTLRMIRGLLGRDAGGLKLAMNVVVGVVPAVLAGLALEKPIKRLLFGGEAYGLWPVAAAWIVGGIGILAIARWRAAREEQSEAGLSLEQLTWKQALVVGLCQCVAMWPGVSRSLMTILGGSLVGLRLTAAVEFSFLLGVVTLGGATAKDAVEYGPLMWQMYGPMPLIAGAAAASVSAALAVRWMVAYLNRHGLEIFGYYRVALGALVIWLMALKML